MRLIALPLLGLVAACQSMQSPDAAKSEVAAASQTWAGAFNSCNAAGAAGLYLPDGVLWGTLARTIISGRPGVQGYFERVCAGALSFKVSFGEQLIRVYGDTAINSGTYTFTAVVQGQPRLFPARYSFTYRKVDGQWLIADHHSSALPAPPAPPAEPASAPK
jgi:uncharacterized protein (TIGR02246 family)